MDKKYLFPTDTAFTVTKFLEEYFKKMMEYKFTKEVEEDFDKVAQGKEKYDEMLKNFWE
jgi:DNA topoisomerase-1